MITLIATLILIFGGIDLLSVGVAGFDIVAWIFGSSGAAGARVLYVLIGLCAVWLTAYLIRVRGRMGVKV